VRKGGLEPPRYCYRQPLKLFRGVGVGPHMRILLPPCEQTETDADALTAPIRTRFAHPNLYLLRTTP
jgi:hypothetical protein